MQQRQQKLEKMYQTLWDIATEYSQCCWENDSNWSNDRCIKYMYGPVLGKYRENDQQLYDIITEEYSNQELCDVILSCVEYSIQQLESKELVDCMDELRYIRLLRDKDLLEQELIDEWIEQSFLNSLDMTGEIHHVRGLCYVYYGYQNYYNTITSIYNQDITNIMEIYRDTLGKESQLSKYKLIEIDSQCELMSINPPRLYDAKVDKTIYLANVSEELLDIFINLKKQNLYQRLSVRGSNLTSKIFDGRNTGMILQEALQYGKLFSLNNINSVPVTKLYSKSFEDNLWVQVDSSNITFEELYKKQQKYDKSIITQVVHLEYSKYNSEVVITHIDHEFIFYSANEYELRKKAYQTKGTDQPRLKSFKIDGAKIPFSLLVDRTISVPNESGSAFKREQEKVPFIIYVLKSYFKHTDLIDEYFTNLCGSENN